MTTSHSAVPAKPVLLTGASGALGQVLAHAFAALGWDLRLTDRVPFPGTLPPNCRFILADLADGAAILRAAEGCGTVLHFGGISVEKPFETVLEPNIRGLYHAYEAARREGARMVFASSNHLIGFHERDEVLDDDSPYRADGYYGLSKAYGELMGRLYWDKNAVESVFLRIGSCVPEPIDDRMLSTWLSYGDLTRLVERSVLAPSTGPAGCLVIWGASRNNRMTWWRKDGRDILGWAPEDSADGYSERLVGRTSGNPVAERHQGGGYCAIDYTRSEPVRRAGSKDDLSGTRPDGNGDKVLMDTPLRIMCALVVKGAFDAAIVPAFQASGGALSIDWAPTSVIMGRISEGARSDVVFVLSEAMDRLVADGLVKPASRVDVCRSRYGIAVLAGTPHPAIDTVEALVRTLTGARSVAFSRTGASGIYFDKLVTRLGIADAVRARATIIPSGFTAEKLVSREADIAVQQISELMVVPGVEIVGAFPDPVQEVTTFSVAVMTDAVAPDDAARFLSALTTPQAARAYETSGLQAAFR